MPAYDPITDTKLCPKCGIRKPGLDFTRRKGHGKDPYSGYCRACSSASFSVWKISKDSKPKREPAFDRKTNTKRCSKCKFRKPCSRFHKNARLPHPDHADPYKSNCRECSVKMVAEARKLRGDADAEKRRQQHRNWYKNNRVRSNKQSMDWRADPNNKGSIQASRARRRARKRSAEGMYTADDTVRIKALQRSMCAACEIRLDDKFHVDHIKPLAKGGSNWPHNLQLLCEKCNHEKHAIDPILFMQRRGFLL